MSTRTTPTPHTPADSGHEYDGIREYDNPTPGWWIMILNVTIVFSVLYAIFWHVSYSGYTIQESWEDDQREEFKRIFGSVGQLDTTEDSILQQMARPDFMVIAKSRFLGSCAACHGREGGGDVGVNLCDDSYKNVKTVADIYRVITEGANNGAMPSWKNNLSQNQRVILAAYVASLRGTTPSVAKPAEGTVIPPWPAPKKAPAPETPSPAPAPAR